MSMTAEQAASDVVNKYILEARDRDIHYIPMLPQLTKILTAALRAHANAALERAATVCKELEGDGDKPTDRLIGYDECVAAIRALREEE